MTSSKRQASLQMFLPEQRHLPRPTSMESPPLLLDQSVQDSLDGGPWNLRPCLVKRFNWLWSGDCCWSLGRFFLASLGDTLRFLPRPLVDYALDGCHRDIILLWNGLAITLSFTVGSTRRWRRSSLSSFFLAMVIQARTKLFEKGVRILRQVRTQ